MKLTIELVPTTCWYSNVRSNVSAETWTRLQRETAHKAGNRCEICGRQGMQHPVEAHEVWEYQDLLRIQRLLGLVALCPYCHEVKHFGHAMKCGRTRQALAWLASVNSLTPEQAVAYVKEAFEVQQARSAHDWVLDLALLTKRYGVRLDRSYREFC